MLKAFINLLLLSTFALGCSRSGSFSRTSKDSFEKPGVIVIGADKKKVAEFINENGLAARTLGQENIFDIEATDIEALKKSFPNSKVIADQLVEPPPPEDPFLVELSPEEARKIAFEQLSRIQLTEAQKLARGKSVLVAVIDSGLNVNRFDIKDNVWKNENEIPNNKIDDDKNGYIDDINGWNFYDQDPNLLDSSPHGTMSAAVIASPLTGIAPEAKVAGLRITNDIGVATYSTTIEAILYARKIGADIINESMGSATVPPEMLTALNELASDDVLLIHSAGNNGLPCEKYPSLSILFDNPNLLAVAAMTLSAGPLDLASYSNYGECVHIGAPAGEGYGPEDQFRLGIVAAHPYSETDFILYHGTSAAAPVVSGVAALAKSANPKLTAPELRELLRNSSDTHEILKGKVHGARAVNALSAVKAALSQ